MVTCRPFPASAQQSSPARQLAVQPSTLHPATAADKPWQLIDDIVLHLADEQGDDTTRSVLLKYKQESQVGGH